MFKLREVIFLILIAWVIVFYTPNHVYGVACAPLGTSITPPAPGAVAKPSGFQINLPWDSNRQHQILRAYGEITHVGTNRPSRLNDHHALDFDLGLNESVRAIADGKVKFAGTATGDGFKTLGKIVFLDHENGFQSGYYHLNRLDVSTNQRVTANQVLGGAGQTGDGFIVHLHVAVYKNAKFSFDPANRGPFGGQSTVPEPFSGEREYVGIRKYQCLIARFGCPIAPGQGSSRQQAFIDAYNRNGGIESFRCPTEYANWWGGLVRQELQGAPQVGVSALLHDEVADANDYTPPPHAVPAYMVQGGFWTGFYKPLGPILGAPASDHYINAFGRPQTDFRNGWAWWDGANIIWHRPLLKSLTRPEVYLIERGSRRWIPTEETLFALGYTWADLEVVSDERLNLYPEGPQIPDVGTTWLSQYYDNRLWLRPAKVTRSEGEINFDWGFGSPDPLVPSDNFSAVFSRYLDFAGGQYELTLNLDDSVWLYLDGNLIFSRGCCGPSTNTLTLPAGRHLMQIRYRAYTWLDYLSLSFKPLDNIPPVADIGGPYLANEGDTLTYDASGSFDPEPGTGIAKIEWDLDSDGEYDDATGFTVQESFGDDFEKPISIKVTDGVGNFSTDSTSVTIENVVPTVILDKSNLTSFFGGEAFLATLDDLLSFPLRVIDPGSDDLTIFANFGDTSTQADTFFNDPNLGPDPFPSIEINPRDINIAKLHQYHLPNVFPLVVTAIDDDGGISEDSLLVLITANQTEIRTQGFWKNQYGQDLGEGIQYPQDFLFGFWEISKFVSKVFDEVAPADTLAGIEDILSKDGEGNPMIERAKTQCLATLLNFSSGSVKWNSQVDTNYDGISDTIFSEAIIQAEDLIVSETSTDQELEQAKDICDSINNMGTIASSGFNFAYLFVLGLPALLVLGRILIRILI